MPSKLSLSIILIIFLSLSLAAIAIIPMYHDGSAKNNAAIMVIQVVQVALTNRIQNQMTMMIIITNILILMTMAAIVQKRIRHLSF
jgi:hypothetical protein